MKQVPYYDRDVDFDELAKRDPDFTTISQHGKRDGFINFQDTKIVQYIFPYPVSKTILIQS